MVRKLVALPSLMACLIAAASFAETPAPKETPAKAEAPAVLVVGDSQAQGVAGALIRRYLRSKDFHVIDKSKIGTGLNFVRERFIVTKAHGHAAWMRPGIFGRFTER